MAKKGIVAASLDPITRGHSWLIDRALDLVDELWVVIGVNAAKKYDFSATERLDIATEVLRDSLSPENFKRLHIVFLENDLLINYASQIGVSHIIRGIRNTEDFNYEHQIQLVNKKINPNIETLYLIPPSNLTQVSSSTVKGLVGFNDWEKAVEDYVHPLVVERFRIRLQAQKQAALKRQLQEKHDAEAV